MIDMKILRIDQKKISNKEINNITAQFKRGLVIAYPTDTIYGLGCLAINEKAVEKIFKIKKRAKNKPMLILVGSLAMLKKYCCVNKSQNEYLKKIWSGTKSVSVVLKSKSNLPNTLTGGAGSIAVRLPKNDFLVKIIKKIGAPIVSTSLNKSGKEPKTDVADLEKYFGKNSPGAIIDAGFLKGKPSKLVDLRDVYNAKILRK